MTCLIKGSNQRRCTSQTVQGLGSSGLGEPCTLKQGSAFGRTSNCKYPSRSFRTISPQRSRGRSFPTERTTSSQWPSGIMSTLDGHEARQAPFRGRLGFPTQAVTKAGKEEESGADPIAGAACKGTSTRGTRNSSQPATYLSYPRSYPAISAEKQRSFHQVASGACLHGSC